LLTPGDWTVLERLVGRALDELDHGNNPAALYSAWNAVSELKNMAGRFDDQLEAVDKALEYARLAGMEHSLVNVGPGMGSARLWGSTPASALLAWLDDASRDLAAGTNKPWELTFRSIALAMLGDASQAVSEFAAAMRRLEDQGAAFVQAWTSSQMGAIVHELCGDVTGAVEVGRQGCGVLEEAGERAILSTGLGHLARNLAALGRLDEADVQARKALEYGGEHDLATQTLAHAALSRVACTRGDLHDAEREAQLAVEAVITMQSPWFQAEALCDLAAAFVASGRTDEAAAVYSDAIHRYERKEHRVGAARARHALAALEAT
jgi:tetratricopeptide (TPR) repeat protein